MNRLEIRVLALAGVAQCALVVQQLARRGRAEAEPFQCSLETIVRLDQENSVAVLGGVDGVFSGLKELSRQRPDPSAIERLRYTIAMIGLQKNLRADPVASQQVRDALLAIRDDPEIEDWVDEGVIGAFSEVYESILSKLSPRIMVHGEQRYLETPQIPPQVRAVLLAGVRAAYVFHDQGGRKFQLFLSRKRIAAVAAQLQQSQAA